MRKLYLAMASCVALVAFMGFSASALAEPKADPFCVANGNPFEVLDLSIVMGSDQAHEVASLLGEDYACGSEIDDGFVGAETLVNHTTVSLPPGFEIADTDPAEGGPDIGSWAGMATINFLAHDPEGNASFTPNVPLFVTTDDKDECRREIAEEIVGEVPEGGMISCLHVTAPGGVWGNWSWAVRDPKTGQQSFTIGPMHTPHPAVEPGLTYFKLLLCAKFGDANIFSCDATDKWQQKNGHGGSSCGYGDFTVTATREDEQVTPAALFHVEWQESIGKSNPHPCGPPIIFKAATMVP